MIKFSLKSTLSYLKMSDYSKEQHKGIQNLNLSTWHEVPRIHHDDEQISPIFFADDAMLALQGDQIQAIIDTLEKIAEY